MDALDSTRSANASRVTVPLPPAGHTAARDAVENFRAKVQQYGDQRDFPDTGGTSRLSIYLKNGSITSRQVIALLGLGNEDFKSRSGTAIFLKEIAWREFYYHILWHNPHVEHQAFNPAYKDLQWENNPQWFELWTQGRTGYPIVDAGMRELNTTGWMHNRVRMIVSSFLTKDLLIDWRWGERYFMQKLLDGDLAPNNGGWQWSASTGCDPQPYFRIFNPELQSKKFDPDGRYIARHVPELAKLAGTAAIHSPPDDLYFSRSTYVAPVVVHSEQRLKAMALFKQQ
jgi:deoxyribodipyrimidine photo-lyase